MVEQPLGLSPGFHDFDQVIVRARIQTLDRASRRAKLALDLEFPHMKEHQVGPASTILAIPIEEQAAKDLLIVLHNLSQELGWNVVLPPRGGMAG